MNDLGKDNVGKLLFRLATPAILAQLINALYNVVDRIYLGHIPEVGHLALTGVGITFPILMIISAFSALIGMGGAPLASIRMGENRNDKAEQILSTCFITLIGISILLTAFFLLFKRPLLFAFGASEQTIPYADSYITIYLYGTIFVQMALGLNAFINSQGFAKIGMFTVLIGAILNIILDPIFIFVFHLGVRGAALATIISQGVSAIWVLAFLFGKKTHLHVRKKYFKIDWKVLGSVMALGVSPFIMQSTESLVNIVLNSTLQRYGGDPAVGSMTIITSIMQFALMPLMGLTQGAQPIISYNFGAKQLDRVRHAFKLLLFSCLAFSVFVCGFCLLVPRVPVSVFTNTPELAASTAYYLRIFIAGTFMMGAQMACQNTFIALGEAKASLFLALLRKVILLIPLVYLFSSLTGTIGVFLAQPIADILAASTTVILFTIKTKKLFRRDAHAA
jgi:putative MATE family efflux protein